MPTRPCCLSAGPGVHAYPDQAKRKTLWKVMNFDPCASIQRHLRVTVRQRSTPAQEFGSHC